jgi:hypothetical protein
MANQAYLILSVTGKAAWQRPILPTLQEFETVGTIAESAGTPHVVQLAHPGRMSPTGRQRLADMPLPLLLSLSAKNSATSFAVQPPFAIPKAMYYPK